MHTMSNHRQPAVPFRPHALVHGASTQTLLAMLRPRGIDVMHDERPIVLDAGHDYTGLGKGHPVRMIGYYNASRRPQPSRGLVLILHGWEGCSHSNYNVIIAQALVEAGYAVFRLNLRDHGPHLHVNPYTLNRGLFMGSLVEEAIAATHRVAELAGDGPFYIMGASMGGNFALRLAIAHSQQPFAALRKVIAVCPAVNPNRATDALDSHPATRRYFRARWLRSLRAKQHLYPDLYDFTPLEQIPLVRDMTAWIIERYGHLVHGQFRSVDDYFQAYAVPFDGFAHLSVPTTILAAANDPVIPVVDFYALATHPLLDIQIHPTGGHCGFMDVLPLRHRMPELVMAELDR